MKKTHLIILIPILIVLCVVGMFLLV